MRVRCEVQLCAREFEINKYYINGHDVPKAVGPLGRKKLEDKAVMVPYLYENTHTVCSQRRGAGGPKAKPKGVARVTQ